MNKKKNYFNTEKKLKAAIEAAKGSIERQYLPVAPRLTLQIGTRGKKVWIFKPQNKEGKVLTFNFGTYPEVSLKNALNEAQIALESLAVNYKSINTKKLERTDIRTLDYIPKPLATEPELTLEEVQSLAHSQGMVLNVRTTYQLYTPGSDGGIWTKNSLKEIVQQLELLQPAIPQYEVGQGVYLITPYSDIDCCYISSVVFRDGKYFYEVEDFPRVLIEEQELFLDPADAIKFHIQLLKDQLSQYENPMIGDAQ